MRVRWNSERGGDRRGNLPSPPIPSFRRGNPTNRAGRGSSLPLNIGPRLLGAGGGRYGHVRFGADCGAVGGSAAVGATVGACWRGTCANAFGVGAGVLPGNALGGSPGTALPGVGAPGRFRSGPLTLRAGTRLIGAAGATTLEFIRRTHRSSPAKAPTASCSRVSCSTAPTQMLDADALVSLKRSRGSRCAASRSRAAPPTASRSRTAPAASPTAP